MGDYFQWDDDYRIGIEPIDGQHQHLFRLVNRLFADPPEDELEGALMELFRYTREHFKAEEAYMKAIGYPGYASHRAQHDALIEQLNEYAGRVVRERGQMPALRAFLSHWVTQHILLQDQAIARFGHGA